MGEERERDMVMPADPAADLIVVQANLALGFQDAGFHRPAHAAQPDQRRQRGVRRRIGKVGLERRCIAQAAPQHHPHVWPLLGEVAAIHDQHARLRVAERRRDDLLVTEQHRLGIPGALAT